MKTRALFVAVIVGAAMTADAAIFKKSDTKTWDVPLAMFGSFWIENPLGNIDITGVDSDRIAISATRTVYVEDQDLLDSALDQCEVNWEGSEKVRWVKTQPRSVRMRCSVAYTVKVPRSVDVKVAGRHGDVVIRDLNGNVTVKSFTSNVTLSGVAGASAIELTNGRIIYDYKRAPLANAQATIITGNIEMYIPQEANFEWAGDTLAGDMRTTFPVRGNLTGSSFRGHVNAPGGPTLRTQTVMGRTFVIAKGTPLSASQSVRDLASNIRQRPAASPYGMPTQKVQIPIVGGTFDYRFPDRFADIVVGEVRGDARVLMAAGGIDLGVVYGDTNVSTGGGPLNLGELMATVSAKTGGGDILVRAARVGGDLHTIGGVIRVFYAGGPMDLQSGGGDIIVRQANAAINARTPSGDITITADPTARALKMNAQTSKGNIIINLTPRFAADIDATIITSNPGENSIHSDFPSLSIRREQVNGRTRIRATGKINGGGDRIELTTDNGDISITSSATAPVMVITPPGQ